MDERAELVERLFTVLEEVKNCAVDAQGEKKEFLEWLQDKAEKLLDMERELNEKYFGGQKYANVWETNR